MTGKILPYLRLIKGKYWYFRSKETGNIRVPGNIRDAVFHEVYAALLKERETAREFRKARRTQAKTKGRPQQPE